MKPTLVIKKGGRDSQTIRLRKASTVIGRMQGCDVRIPSREVSRHHCKVELKRQYLLVEDLDSANGTFVNGERVEGRQGLEPGDMLKVGPVVFVVHYELSSVGRKQMEADNLLHAPVSAASNSKEDADDDSIEIDVEVSAESKPTPKSRGPRTSSGAAAPTLAEMKNLRGVANKPPSPGSEDEDVDEDDNDTRQVYSLEGEAKKDRKEEEIPDASAILGEDASFTPPSNNDLRNILSQLEEE